MKKNVVLHCTALPHGCRATQHPALRMKTLKGISMGIKWLKGILNTWYMVSKDSHLYSFCTTTHCEHTILGKLVRQDVKLWR
jgi:hypothetical protein